MCELSPGKKLRNSETQKIFDDHNLFVLLIQYIDRCSQGVITRMDLLYCHLKDISVAQTFLSALSLLLTCWSIKLKNGINCTSILSCNTLFYDWLSYSTLTSSCF